MIKLGGLDLQPKYKSGNDKADINASCADISKSKNFLNFFPTTDLSVVLEKLCHQWLQPKSNRTHVFFIHEEISNCNNVINHSKGYRQKTEMTPRPIMHNPPYATGGTLTTSPTIAKPIPEHIVIISPNLRWFFIVQKKLQVAIIKAYVNRVLLN